MRKCANPAIRPQWASGARGLPLLKGQSKPIMAVLAGREMVLGLIAGGLAFTGDFHGLVLAFTIALLIIVIDAIALFQTRSIFGLIVNGLVGLLLVFAVYKLWRDLGGI